MSKVSAWFVRKARAIGNISKRWKKTPEQKARNRVIKLCKEKNAIKISDNGEKAFSRYWYSSAKSLAWQIPWAANYIAGTLKNSQKRGVVGVEGLVNGSMAFIKVEDAINEIRASGRGVFFSHRQKNY